MEKISEEQYMEDKQTALCDPRGGKNDQTTEVTRSEC